MSEATIDSLRLEIDSSSEGASRGLSALTASLKKLQKATSKGLGLTAVVTELKNANTDINSSLDGLNKAVDTLTKLGGVKISSSIGNQLKTISSVLQSADFSSGRQKVESLVNALEPLGQLSKTHLPSTVNALKKLPEAMDKIDTRALYTKVQSLTRIFKPLADEMQKVANGFAAFPVKIQKLIAENDKATASNNRLSTSYINLYAKLRMAWAAVKTLANKIAGWIKLSSDYTETMNLFTVSMGQYAEEAYNYAQIVSDAMGIDPAEWLKAQGTMMTLVKGFGVIGDRANVMSQQLTQLGYDLSSYFNIKVADAMTKLESGIAGELEPLRRLGYDLSQAKLEAVALGLGIDKAVSSMTQAEKAELRYYAIMTQVTDAHGDMARTLNAPANQMRILNAQVTQLGRSLGNFFIPLLNKVLPYIIASVKVLREVLDVVMDLLGIELAEVDFGKGVSATGDITSNLEDGQAAAKKLKSYMMGFDELNVIDTTSDDSGLDGLGTGFDFELPTYDFMEGIVATQIDDIVQKMKEWLGITGEINSWSDLFDTKLGGMLEKVGLIGGVIATWKVTKALTNFITKDIPALKKLIKSTPFTLVVGVALTLVGFADAFIAMKDAIENGLDSFNFVEIIGNSLLGAGGAALLGGKIAGLITKAFASSKIATALTTAASNLGLGSASAAGAALAGAVSGIVLGIPMFITGIYDSIKNGIDWLSATLTAVGATAAGAGIGAIIGACGGPIGAGIGALIGLAVGAITDLVIVVVQNWDEIVEWTKTTCGKIGDAFVSAWDSIVKVWNTVSEWFNVHVITPVANFFTGLWEGMKSTAKACWDGIVGTWNAVSGWFSTNVITPVKNFFTGLWDGIKNGAKACWDGIVAFFTPAVNWFSELFGSVKQTISDIFYNIGVIAKGCWDIIKYAWESASSWFSTNIITPVANFFSGLWNGLINGAKAAWEGIKSAFSAFGSWISTYIITPVKNFFVGLWGAITDGATAAWNGIKNAFTSAATWVNTTVIVPVGNFFSGMWNGLINGARDAWNGIKSVFSSVATFFKDTFKTAWEGVVSIFSYAGNIFVNIRDGIVSVFKTIVNGLINGINSVIASPFNAINNALTTIKNISIAGMTPFSGIRTISVPRIPTLADGGIPKIGQMFIANEAGPELIGNIGGRTAVMNNDQIVESVSAGVYQAVLAALGGNNDDDGNTNIIINLDGEKIYENQQKIARGRGYNMGMGAFSFG